MMLAIALHAVLATQPPDARLDVQLSTKGSTCQVIRNQLPGAPHPDWSFEVLPGFGEREGTEDCRPLAALYVKLANTSCTPAALRSLALLLTDPLTLEVPTHSEQAFAGVASRVGCATVRTSSDGLVRSWTLSTGGYDEALGRAVRGGALLQWKSDEGRIHVVDARAPDLSLDSDVQAIDPLPGTTDAYLFTGLHVRGEFLRFARVLRLGSDGRPRLERVFRVGTATKEELVFQAPGTEKYRHSDLLLRWLRFDAGTLQLRLEPPPDEERAPFLKPSTLPSELVAEWKEGRFEVKGRAWGTLSLR